MAQWGNQDNANSAPVYTTNATTGESGVDEYGTNVFGVSVAEAEVASGPASPGWVRIVEGTGGRAGRRQYETLIAMRHITGDGSDNDVFPNVSITNTVLPEITGTTKVSETLTASDGTWVSDQAPDSYTYAWFADGVAISGATSNTYLLTGGEEGAMITVEVTPVSNAYSGVSATSEPVGPVTA